MDHPHNKSGKVFQLDPLHDGRHELDNFPHARESVVFMLQLPKDDIAAFIYTWVSGDGKAGAALSVYGPAVGNEPIFEACDGIPVSNQMGFDDWRVGELHLRHSKPLEIADASFKGKKASIEYHFEAMHPAYSYASSIAGCPPWMAYDRLEQSGRVKGVLQVGDRVIPFDTFGHRDHSWGTRDWGKVQQSKWLEAQAGPDVAVHVFQYAALGRAGFLGYVQKDGQIAEVTDMQFEFTLDDSYYHTAIDFVIRDTAGRTTTVTCKLFALYEFKVSPVYTLNEGSMSVEIDGKAGVGHVEMGWPKAYLDYIRKNIT